MFNGLLVSFLNVPNVWSVFDLWEMVFKKEAWSCVFEC